jgi:hypothetical protein
VLGQVLERHQPVIRFFGQLQHFNIRLLQSVFSIRLFLSELQALLEIQSKRFENPSLLGENFGRKRLMQNFCLKKEEMPIQSAERVLQFTDTTTDGSRL